MFMGALLQTGRRMEAGSMKVTSEVVDMCRKSKREDVKVQNIVAGKRKVCKREMSKGR